MIKLNRCASCGSVPELLGSGLAKRLYDENGNAVTTYFVDFDGYSVECPECTNGTKVHRDMNKAITEWNVNNLQPSPSCQ